MNRLLPFVYSQFFARLVWPVLAFLTLMLRRIAAFLGSGQVVYSDFPVLEGIRSRIRFAGQGNRVALAIGMLMAGWLGAITHAQAQNGPGCVSPAVWLRGDAGVTLSGTAVTAWASQTGLVTMLPGAVVGFPSLPIGVKAASTNYNPGLTFNNTGWANATTRTYMDYAPTGIINKSAGTIYVVANPTLANANAHLAGWYTDGDYPSVNMTLNRPFYYTEGSSFAYGAPANSLKDNTPFMLGTSWTNGGLGTMYPDVRFNGNSDQTTLMYNVNTSVLVDTPFRLGADTDWGGLTGEMLEVLVFPTALSATEKQKVETYLGVKYGLTKAGNYVSGAGSSTTVIWNTTTNTGYNNNIVGIGRSDCQSLNQKQSRSTNGNTFVTLGNGTGIATTNQLNTNSFSADNLFEMIGDNGAAASYATTYASSFTSSATVFSMSRIWRVQETNAVGTVTVSIPGSGSSTYLLVRSSANGGTFTSNTNTTEILMTPDGNGNLTAQVNFSDGDYFTFARPVYSPGCVPGVALWLKPGSTVQTSGTAVTGWVDSGVSGATLTPPTSANRPSYGNLLNYNPVVTFNNVGLSSQYLQWSPTGNERIQDRSQGTLMAAFRPTVTTANGNLGGWGSSTTPSSSNDPSIAIEGGIQKLFFYPSSAILYPSSPNTLLTPGKATFFSGMWQNGALSSTIGMRVTGDDGVWASSTSRPNINTAVTQETFSIARDSDWGGVTGDYMEVITFSHPLSLTEAQKVDSYLGIKYGVTLPNNYLSGAGATIYDVSSYGSDVTGIGRDDCQELDQRQSKSVNPTGMVTIGNGAGIAATNQANGNAFSANASFEVIGHNGLPSSYSTTYTPSTFTSTAGVFSMSRIWKVQETGTVGTITVSIPGSGSSTYLLVKNTASFASGATEIQMTPDGNGNLTAQVNFTDGQFFTFAAPVFAPGCVANGLALWVKADVPGAAISAATTSWPDNSPNNKAVPAIGTMTVTAPDAAHNYYPYFTGFSTANFFRDANSPVSPSTDNASAAGAYIGVQSPTDLAIFAIVRPNSAVSGRITGIDNELPNENYAAEPGVSSYLGYSHFVVGHRVIASFRDSKL